MFNSFLKYAKLIILITVFCGNFERMFIKALCICSALPSKNRPQPEINKVSPVNTCKQIHKKKQSESI